jgi:hypothetical protein
MDDGTPAIVRFEDIMPDQAAEDLPDLSIPTGKLCFIVAKARELDAKDEVTDPGDSSNATDDAMVSEEALSQFGMSCEE